MSLSLSLFSHFTVTDFHNRGVSRFHSSRADLSAMGFQPVKACAVAMVGLVILQPAMAFLQPATAPAAAKTAAALKLPAPDKKAWQDVRNQCEALARKGKPELLNAFKAAKKEGNQARREFYYHVFLLDGSVAKKEVHKESMQKQKSLESTKKGWITPFQYGVMLGLDKNDPDFATLCEAACEGLPQRQHENAALAKAGRIQVYAEVRQLDEEQRVHESSTKAQQRLENEHMDADAFQRVENALMVQPLQQQVVLGQTRALDNGSAQPAKAKEVDEEVDLLAAYKNLYKKLRAELNKFGTQLANAELLLGTLNNSTGKPEEAEQLKAVSTTLEGQIKGAQKSKESFLKVMGQKLICPSLRDGCPEAEAKVKLQEISDLKGEIETSLKSFVKAWSLQKQVASSLSLA